MRQVAEIFLKWWDAMALLYQRYGPTADVEEKPEWEEVMQLQRGWLAELAKMTASDEDVLFETVQVAIGRVLGRANDVEVALALEDAVRIIEEAVSITLTTEVRRAEAAGMVN